MNARNFAAILLVLSLASPSWAEPPDCDDGKPCTIDYRPVGSTGCLHQWDPACCISAAGCPVHVCAHARCEANACVYDTAACDGKACDDGLFCNGADTCLNGTCSAHANYPCTSSQTCDEAKDACVPKPTGCGM